MDPDPEVFNENPRCTAVLVNVSYHLMRDPFRAHRHQQIVVETGVVVEDEARPAAAGYEVRNVSPLPGVVDIQVGRIHRTHPVKAECLCEKMPV